MTEQIGQHIDTRPGVGQIAAERGRLNLRNLIGRGLTHTDGNWELVAPAA